MPTARVVVDVQQGMFSFDPPPYRAAEVLERITALLERGRAAGVPIFHIRHDGGPGHG